MDRLSLTSDRREDTRSGRSLTAETARSATLIYLSLGRYMNTTRLPLLPAVVRERARSTPDAPAVVAGASERELRRPARADRRAQRAPAPPWREARRPRRDPRPQLDRMGRRVPRVPRRGRGRGTAQLPAQPVRAGGSRSRCCKPRLVLADEEFLESATAGARRRRLDAAAAHGSGHRPRSRSGRAAPPARSPRPSRPRPTR